MTLNAFFTGSDWAVVSRFIAVVAVCVTVVPACFGGLGI
jgi:hypothetical protein